MFEVPKSKASTKEGRFEFKVPGNSKAYSFPKLQYLPMPIMKRVQTIASIAKKVAEAQKKRKQYEPTEQEQAKLMDTIMLLFETYAPELLDELDQEQVNAIVSAWGQDSSVGLGES
jgi:hypothetical protein|nr:MAG TPA: hypothetical protein [Caudoviricetes sp.]